MCARFLMIFIPSAALILTRRLPMLNNGLTKDVFDRAPIAQTR